MGHHDALDGLITYNQLKMTASKDIENPTEDDLYEEISDMAEICQGKDWTTDDPLGIGGLLCDAFRAAQLIVRDNFHEIELLGNLLDSSLQGLRLYEPKNNLKYPAEYRLAFRELGLSIGLRAVERLQDLIDQNYRYFFKTPGLSSRVESLMRYLKLRDEIELFWLNGTNRETETWKAHRDINTVMLATSLAPDGYLKLYLNHNETKNRSTG
jgi:hypothetical protein